VAKPQLPTINAGNEAINGATETINNEVVVDLSIYDESNANTSRSVLKKPSTSSIATRSEARRGTYIPSEDVPPKEIGEGNEEHYIESNDGDPHHDESKKITGNLHMQMGDYDVDASHPSSTSKTITDLYHLSEDENDPEDPYEAELDDIKMGYEVSKREAELLRTCSELNKVIDDLRRSKESRSDMRTKSAGNTPFARRSDAIPINNRRRSPQGRSFSPNRENPNLQWRPKAQNCDVDSNLGYGQFPEMSAEVYGLASARHAPVTNGKNTNGNMSTFLTTSANPASQVTATTLVGTNALHAKDNDANVKEPNGKKAWADLLKQEHIPNFQLDYIKPESNDITIVDIPDCVISEGAREWDTTLVGYFLGRRLPYSLVSNSAHRMWDKFGLYEILATDSGYFFFKFNSKAQSEAIIEGGPWHFAGQPIIMKCWTPGLTLSKDSRSTIPVWVNFFYLPMELWGPEGLNRVASAIGKPLQVDRMTATKRRISYARVCIDMSAENEPIEELTVQFNNPKTGNREAVNVKVQYQWTPTRCAKCKSFGHNCEKKTQVPTPKSMEMKKGSSNNVWTVRRKGKEVEDTSDPFHSLQPTLSNTKCVSSCSTQVEFQNLDHNQMPELGKEQSHAVCISAVDVPVASLSNKIGNQQQVKDQHYEPISDEGMETVKEHSISHGGSAGMAPAAAQTTRIVGQQQADKQPYDQNRNDGVAIGKIMVAGNLVKQSNKFSILNDFPDDEVTNEVDQGQAQDPPDDVTGEGHIDELLGNIMQLSSKKLNRFVDTTTLTSLNDN